MFDATLIFYVAILIMSIVIHEVSHGVSAYLQGDKTASYAGRLTLNPIPHLDPIGSLLIPLILVATQSPFLFGWAKPVPYNPYNLRNQTWGPALVGLAGPLSNITIAILFGSILRFGPDVGILLPTAFLYVSAQIVWMNISLAVLNMIPIPPLDGSKLLYVIFPRQSYKFEEFFGTYGLLLIFPVLFILSPIISSISQLLMRLIIGG